MGITNPAQRLTVAGNIAPSTTNNYDLGTASVLFRDAYVTNGVTLTSDARKKNNIKDSDLGLEFINSLRPVSYFWNEGDKNLHYGIIAQETKETLKDFKTRSGRSNEVDNVIVTHDKKSDAYGVRYTELIAPIIKAIKELYDQFLDLSSELTVLKNQNELQQQEIQKLKLENAAIKNYLCNKDSTAVICK